jgi:hypothetical protein
MGHLAQPHRLRGLTPKQAKLNLRVLVVDKGGPKLKRPAVKDDNQAPTEN